MNRVVKFDVKEGIATLVLNSPKTRNAITGRDVIDAVVEACNRVNSDTGIRVMVITGVDPAFSSGGNIKDMAAKKGMFAGSAMELAENYRNNVQQIPLAVYRVKVPTIAAVNGPAIGAGCDLACMCDMRIASEKARFGETFLAVGLIPGDGGAYFLPRIIGMARACEMTFTARVIDAKQALEYGLVNRVVPHEKLMDAAYELAEEIASKPGPALRMAKQLLYAGMSTSLENLLEQSAAYQAICHHTEDHMEALSAMFEKRKPEFKGR